MDAIKFSDKALSVFPMAFYFSAVKSFEERIGTAECTLDRFREMRDEYDGCSRLSTRPTNGRRRAS